MRTDTVIPSEFVVLIVLHPYYTTSSAVVKIFFDNISIITRGINIKKPLAFASGFLVETIGVEPMTSCMSSMRSNQLSYASATNGWYYITLCPEMQALFQIFSKNFFCG